MPEFSIDTTTDEVRIDEKVFSVPDESWQAALVMLNALEKSIENLRLRIR